MRWSKRRTWGLLLSGLLAANGVRAGEVEDTALTVAVRKALKRDERLAALGLGVTVENGHVTIWGPVPTGDLIAYAGGCVRQLEGVKTVTNDLHIQPAIAVQVAAPRTTDVPEPIVLVPLPGLPELPLAKRLEPEIRPEEARRTAAKEPFAPGGTLRASATLMRPESSDIADQIELLRLRDPRYKGLTVSIQSGFVRLTGTLPSWNDLWPIAEEVSKLPGVKRVVVDKITIAKKI